MKRMALCLLLLGIAAAPAAAQTEGDTQGRSSHLRERVEKRFAERVKAELELTDDQAARLKAVATEHGARRRELRHRERSLRAAIERQLGDESTARPDSLSRLTRELLSLRVEYAENWRDEMQQLSSFLTPVQAARLLVMRERLLQRVHDMRKEHRGFRGHGEAH
jgi:Spy/CpxP family protein refolding chaperone